MLLPILDDPHWPGNRAPTTHPRLGLTGSAFHFLYQQVESDVKFRFWRAVVAISRGSKPQLLALNYWPVYWPVAVIR